MDKSRLIQDLTNRFSSKRDTFLCEVRQDVVEYISNQGAGCLALVEKANGCSEIWKLSAHPGYARRLIAFCRGMPCDGHHIDSGLTSPVISIVTARFQALYQSNDEEIAKAVLAYILHDNKLSAGLLGSVVGSATAGLASDAIKQRVATLLIDQLRTIMQTGGAKTIAATVGKSVAAVATKPIATKIAMLLMKVIAGHLKVVIAKVLASAAIKALIAATVKKFLIAAVAAVVVKAVAAKFGITMSAAFLWILIPVIAAYLVYEVATFPKHLAEKVADKIIEDLRGDYSAINKDVFEQIVDEVLGPGIGVLAQRLGECEPVQRGIEELIAALA